MFHQHMSRSTYAGALGLLLGCLVAAPFGFAQPPAAHATREVRPFDADWRFSLGEFPSAALPAFDDKGWRLVELPHDWSAEGPFSANYGSGNGYAPGGVGWYRKHFSLPESAKGRIATLEFDGVYDHAEVWVNGHLVCGRPYGYSSFECRITRHLRFEPAENVVAVRVDHSRFADSRWYTGSGIYRHVRLRLQNPLHLAQWGTFVTTPVVSTERAVVKVETSVDNDAGEAADFTLESQVLLDGRVVASSRSSGRAEAARSSALVQELPLVRPARWTPDSPSLYVLRQQLLRGTQVEDEADISFGVRSIRFDPNGGFLLNDVPTRLKGVCLHHDAGALGAAVPVEVWERRLRTLKSLGVNAIRTSHNPPAPEFLDLCDRLGFLVKDEAFDEFTPAKNKWVAGWNEGVPSRFGYAEEFARWSVTDVEDMVRRDRNHPSVILWSIGNEIDYPNDPFSHPVLGKSYRPENPPASDLVLHARPLIAAVKRFDSTRPVTAALASVEMSDAVGLPALLDVVGYNYQEGRYASDHARYPQRIIFGSETDHQVKNWTLVRDNAYVAGQFLWTGIDYLGEAHLFPNRVNTAGLLDVAGFKKPLAWYRQSLWSEAPFVYLAASESRATGTRRPVLAEHWNWPGGAPLQVTAFTTCDEVELFLNGKSLGRRRRSEAADAALHWDVPYQPGMLKAVGFVCGQQVTTFELRTASAATRVELRPLAVVGPVREIEVRVVDGNGIRVPDAAVPVTFALDGAAVWLAAGNANPNDTAAGSAPVHETWQGRAVATIRVTGQGRIRLRASAPGLAPGVIELEGTR